MNKPNYLLFKKCSKCGEILHVSKFHKHKNGKYGVKKWCKKCCKEDNKKYYEDNKEYYKNYYENNKEDISKKRKENYDKEKNRESCKKYREEHKKEIAIKSKENYKKNREEYCRLNRENYKKNREEKLKYQREYYENHKEERLEYSRNYRENNPEKIFNNATKRRKKKENLGNGITKEQWYEMFMFFDFRCAYSGEYLGNENNKKIRSIDHIIPLDNNGEHEIWNCVPMYRPYNSGKSTKNMLDWYLQQEYFDIDRLTKIYEWRIYAYWKYKVGDN